MSFFNFFHDLFGDFHGNNPRHPEFENDDSFPRKKPTDPGWNFGFEGNDNDPFSSMFNFSVITDPFEMQQRAEKTMNEMMMSFFGPAGFPRLGPNEPPESPALTEKQNLRDHYLKLGVGKPSSPWDKNGDEKSGPITPWTDFFRPNTGQEDQSSQPRVFSSFRTVIRKSVQLPDGTVKTEEIIRNSDGTEERTETHSVRDGSDLPPSIDLPLVIPDLPGFSFNYPKVPAIEDPRYSVLKPGFETPNPFGEKIDKDLDQQIAQSGIKSLPPFGKESEAVQPNHNGTFNSFKTKITTFSEGVSKSEEVIRNPDGTEQRTVTYTYPDGTTKTVTDQSGESLLSGQHKNLFVEGREKSSYTLLGIKDVIDKLFK